MTIVLDTNVLVSGLLKPYSNAGTIVRLVAAGSIKLAYDARILAEYREVLARRKFSFDQQAVEALLDLIKAEGLTVAASPLKQGLLDPGDEPFAEIALATGAAIVTGNRKHFPPDACRGIRILSPSEFLQEFSTV